MSKHLDPQYPLWECLSICSLKEKEVKKIERARGFMGGVGGRQGKGEMF